jgi:hypothetical protein
MISANPYVPKNANVLYTVSYCSGEIVYTYYILDDKPYKICDWVGSKPEPITHEELMQDRKLTAWCSRMAASGGQAQ